MKKNLLATFFRETGKGLLLIGGTIVGLALTEKSCFKLTGDEIITTHPFKDTTGRQAIVIRSDTFRIDTTHKPKPK